MCVILFLRLKPKHIFKQGNYNKKIAPMGVFHRDIKKNRIFRVVLSSEDKSSQTNLFENF